MLTSRGQLLTGMSKTELGQGAVCTVANLELKLCLKGQLAFAASHSVPGRSNVIPFSKRTWRAGILCDISQILSTDD